ncbi:hypothetical protein MD484_g7432, partial [Candolleomyces efflorescens]
MEEADRLAREALRKHREAEKQHKEALELQSRARMREESARRKLSDILRWEKELAEKESQLQRLEGELKRQVWQLKYVQQMKVKKEEAAMLDEELKQKMHELEDLKQKQAELKASKKEQEEELKLAKEVCTDGPELPLLDQDEAPRDAPIEDEEELQQEEEANTRRDEENRRRRERENLEEKERREEERDRKKAQQREEQEKALAEQEQYAMRLQEEERLAFEAEENIKREAAERQRAGREREIEVEQMRRAREEEERFERLRKEQEEARRLDEEREKRRLYEEALQAEFRRQEEDIKRKKAGGERKRQDSGGFDSARTSSQETLRPSSKLEIEPSLNEVDGRQLCQELEEMHPTAEVLDRATSNGNQPQQKRRGEKEKENKARWKEKKKGKKKLECKEQGTEFTTSLPTSRHTKAFIKSHLGKTIGRFVRSALWFNRSTSMQKEEGRQNEFEVTTGPLLDPLTRPSSTSTGDTGQVAESATELEGELKGEGRIIITEYGESQRKGVNSSSYDQIPERREGDLTGEQRNWSRMGDVRWIIQEKDPKGKAEEGHDSGGVGRELGKKLNGFDPSNVGGPTPLFTGAHNFVISNATFICTDVCTFS